MPPPRAFNREMEGFSDEGAHHVGQSADGEIDLLCGGEDVQENLVYVLRRDVLKDIRAEAEVERLA